MTEPNNNEDNNVASAEDIAAAQVAEEFTTTIGDQVSEEAEDDADVAVEPEGIEGPIQTVGRRKRAIVRVRLVPGTGKFSCNGRSLEDYFPNKLHQQLVRAPFTILDLEGRFDVVARINGGGVSGQAGALRLGIARALNEIDREANRATLKKAGFLTRDSRIVERKKAGLHKARRAPQYSKR